MTLLEVRRPNEAGQTENPKYCSYYRLISHSIEDCFVLKGKLQDLIDSGSISLPKDSIKASVYQVSIRKDALEVNEH